MTDRLTMLLRILSVIALAALTASANGGRGERLVVVATVAGYDQLSPLVGLTSVPQSQLLIVRVENHIKGGEEARYIKVIYKSGPGEAPLPEGILDGKSRWRFTLTRDRGCDSSVRELLPERSRTEEGTEATLPSLKRTNTTEEIPAGANLPCYVLRPGGLKPSS